LKHFPVEVCHAGMKNILALTFLLIAISVNAQDNSKKVEFFTSVDVNQVKHIGGSFSIHPLITPDFSVGAGIDAARIRDLNYYWTPYYIDTRYFLRAKKIQFMLFVQASPGSLFHESKKAEFSTQVVLNRYNRSFLGGGLGFALGSPSSKARPYFALKARRYQMEEVNQFLNTSRKFGQDQFTLSVGLNW
jgi:hypothetical protein